MRAVWTVQARHVVRGLLAAAAMLVVLGASVAAQTVRPAVVEIKPGKHGSDGHFEIANDTLEPLAVTLEAKSFTIRNDGVAVFRPLASEIHLQLSETSMRLPPRQSRTVYYQVTAPQYPVWFCIYSNLTPLAHRPGVRVQLELPHTVYVLRPGKAAPAAVQIASLARVGNGLHATVHNNGADVVRVTSLQATGAHTKREEAGFPLLPGGERQIDLNDAGDADTLRVNVAGIHVSERVATSTP